MNDKKVCFIYCVNNQSLLEESLKYIYSLEIPDSFEIDVITIEESMSMAAGYNRAMKESDAKYKVYLHQDVLIINRNLIVDMIKLFTDNPKLGLLGVAGSKNIPSSGIWWDSKFTYGKVYDSHTGNMELLQFNEVTKDYESVHALDGLLLITQFDVPWREDLFDGWHFYDLSQCMEFMKQGYEVGIPKQDHPWCLHDCGIVNTKNGFDLYKKIYKSEYKKIIKETNLLVSILIPSYNRPELLEIALKSALDQTYPNIEIIISDDSSNDEVKEMLEPYLKSYNHIQYIKNKIPLVEKNFSQCVKMASGEYINFLMDDDVLHPNKIEIMAKYLIENENISLVTSHRQLIDEQGHFLPDTTGTKPLFTSVTIIPGKTLGDYCLKTMSNFIGEPTTVLFRRKDIADDFGVFAKKQYTVINDLATWISLLEKGNAVYIPESLSYFRQHSGQNQRSIRFLKDAIPQWLNLFIDSRKRGFLNNETEYKNALFIYMDTVKYVISEAHRQQKFEHLDTEEINASFSLLLKQFTCTDSHFCPYCEQRFQRFIPWPDIYDFENCDWEMWNKRTAICPNCHSLDRERLYKVFIEKETNINNKDLTVLHIAPEKNLRNWLSAKSNLTYVAGDLFPSDKDMIKLDITNIGYNDQHFDVVLCSHVLEHVPDDTKGLMELYRVLKKGGWGIIQVPIALNIKMTVEDPTITTPEDRKRIFGQDDHVRIYSKSDFINRLELVGFRVEEYKPFDSFGEELTNSIGLSEKDVLYIVYRD